MNFSLLYSNSKLPTRFRGYFVLCRCCEKIQIFILFVIIFFGITNYLFTQIAPGKYWIEYTDKNGSPYNINNPQSFLSLKSIERRNKQNIKVDYSDIPVNKNYIDSVKKTGAIILYNSRWFNASAVFTNDSSIINTIKSFSFVKNVKSLKRFKAKIYNKNKGFDNLYSKKEEYGFSYNQINILNGIFLHKLGFKGEGKIIAVMDAGFINADKFDFTKRLLDENKIIATKNFVDNNDNVFTKSYHGSSVLSIMGTYSQFEYIGTAPESKYILFITEDINSEYLIEENNWIAAAEYADSAGADIINTSLSYTIFDDSSQNHSYKNLDGNTTYIAKAAKFCARKGMIVVCSAGNYGNSKWKYIGTPADADSILAVGATDLLGNRVSFSSVGPSYDKRIKPDIVAPGYNVNVMGINGNIIPLSGTSFSSPIIAGLTACLWQSFPEKNNMEIINAIKKSSDQYNDPDSLRGYGLPDFLKAYYFLNDSKTNNSTKNIVIFPNPFIDKINIILNNVENSFNSEVNIILYDSNSKKIWKKVEKYFPERYNFYSYNFFVKNEIAKGLYFLVIKFTDDKIIVKKIIKI